jgi:hypothetical protein
MVWIDERLQLLQPSTAGGLSLFLVVDAAAEPAPPVPGKLLAEALRDGTVTVTEVSEGGSVPVLLVHNRGPDDVLVFAGDVVNGGKQDRVITQDVVLAPADVAQPLPVNCVERSRWHAQGGLAFSYAGKAEPELRRAVQTSRSQLETWRKVDELLVRRGHRSPTDAYTTTLEDGATQADVERSVADLEPALADARAVGVVAAVDGEVDSAEIYETPALFERARPTLLRSLVLGVVGRPPATKPAPTLEETASWLREARSARERERTQHSSSSYASMESENTTGYTLHDSRGRHLKSSHFKK